MPDFLSFLAGKPVCSIHRLATIASICLILLCALEAAYELAWLPLPTQDKTSKAQTTNRDRFWNVAAKLPWTSSGSDARYKYNSLGSSVERPSGRNRAKIGKCTSLFGAHEYGYYGALDTHVEHNQLYHYPAYVLDRSIQDDLWSKHAALLEVLLLELAKPEKDRLQWLVWFDADTMILNRRIPLETFLPPPEMSHVHLIVTKDWNGLNNGVFYLRVSQWNIEMLAAALAYRTYRPNDELPWTEQSAMANLLDESDFVDGAVFVPARWFNAYPAGDPEYHVVRGDMTLHFAGVGDKGKAMQEWLYKLADNRTSWELELAATNLTQEVAQFWDEVKFESQGTER